MNFISPSNLKTQSRFIIASGDEESSLQVKPDSNSNIATQGILLSTSTTGSAVKSQSSDTEGCSSPSSEKNHERIEEKKQEQILDIESGWGKPLKKAQKQTPSDSLKNETKSTAVLTVVKPVAPKKTLQREFYENWRASTREALYKAPPTIIKGGSCDLEMSAKDLKLSSIEIYKSVFKPVKKETVQKLTCSLTGKNVADSSKPRIGYAISFGEDPQARLRPVVMTKLLSYEAFIRSSSQDEAYWLPVYGNKDHFNRSKEIIFNTISSLYQRLEGKTMTEGFHPLMVAKVLPLLLVQIHKKNATLSKDSIEAFSQLHRLFLKLVELMPELKDAVDKEVKSFCSTTEAKSGKNRECDLHEFLIELSVSSEGLQNPSIINFVLQEHLVRQALPVLRKNKDIGRGQHLCGEFLEKYMKASQAANEDLLEVIEICRLLVDKDVASELEMRCGMLSGDMREMLLDRLDWIHRKAVKSWLWFIKTLGQEVLVSSDLVMASYITNSYETAKMRDYLA